jgi:DNA-binding NarL/FixJ family response regulator
MKILLVDDHPVARRGLHVVVTSSFEGCEILEADNATAALGLAQDERPELILLDARMPGSIPPEEVCRVLRELLPDVTIVIVTAFDDVAVLHACLDVGANGCLLKDTAEVDLGAALRATLAGQFVIDPRIARQLAREAAKPLVQEAVRQATQGGVGQLVQGDVRRQPEVTVSLTDREQDVLELLAHGCSNRKIAQQLYLSETTVKGYVTDLLHKLDATSRLEAVVRAYELDLVLRPTRG